MKISDYIVEFLDKKNINTIFGHLGGMNADFVDSIYKQKNIKFMLAYHEQAASFAANAYAVVKGQTSITTSTGAPGFCNLIPGIANAFFDSNPCIFIAGTAHTLAVRTSKNIRQNAFEEIDTLSMVQDITKMAVKIDNPEDIRYYLEKAFYIANEGRKGPVLLDIPYNIARAEVDVASLKGFEPPIVKYDDIDTKKIIEVLKNAQKPLIILGGGARGNKCKTHLKELLNKVKIPVVVSLLGLDVLSHNNTCFAGFIGHYGNRYANLALVNADCLIVIGSRLDERQLCYKTKYNSNVKVIRVDVDKHELNRKISEMISLHSTAEMFLEKLTMSNFDDCNFSKWLNVVNEWKKRYPSYDFSLKETNANNFLHIISDYLPNDAVICGDVGQNQMCVAQSIKLDNERILLNSAGYGSMGFSLPAAIGAAYARPDTAILSVNGDGGIQMNIQELQTVVRDNLPINIIVLNNKCLGMIRRLHENMFDNRTFASVDGYAVPDFAKIAYAYGIDYLRVDSVKKYVEVKDFISHQHPTFIEVVLPQIMQNNPDPGVTLDKQLPLLSDEEYKNIKKEVCFDKE